MSVLGFWGNQGAKVSVFTWSISSSSVSETVESRSDSRSKVAKIPRFGLEVHLRILFKVRDALIGRQPHDMIPHARVIGTPVIGFKEKNWQGILRNKSYFKIVDLESIKSIGNFSKIMAMISQTSYLLLPPARINLPRLNGWPVDPWLINSSRRK